MFENDSDEYHLEAIVQHEGQFAHCGHYVVFLFLNGRWERRDDDRRDIYQAGELPPYTPENVPQSWNGLYAWEGDWRSKFRGEAPRTQLHLVT